MNENNDLQVDYKDVLGAPRRVRVTDPDVFSDPDSARVAARRLGCIGIRRYLNRSGGESWMPCTNESDYRKYSGIGVSGRRFRRQQLERDIRQITGRGKLAKKTLDSAVETKSSKANNYTKPELRERLKQRIMAGSDGGAPGQWSARKAQMLAQAYKKAGGGYKTGGKSKTQRSLSTWTKQNWRTSDGKKARRGNYTRRYLPAKAWSKLTPEQRAATNKKKIEGSKRGEQFVPNTNAARSARKRSVRGAKHSAFYELLEIKSIEGLIEVKALPRRAARRTLQTPGALKPRLNSMGRDLNPATARNADKDPYVLEGIPTINRGRGILDPTPGGKPSRWVPRVRKAPSKPEVAPEAKPARVLQRQAERLPKPLQPQRRESSFDWLPSDSDTWTEDNKRRLFGLHKESGLSYSEFAKRNGLFADDVRDSVETIKNKRKSRLNAFKKNHPKLMSAIGSFGAVRDEAMDAIADGKVKDWPSVVSWAFKDPDLKRQRLSDRAVNDLFNNVSNGLDPDGKSDTVLGFVPSKTKPGKSVKTFAKRGALPPDFTSRFTTRRTAVAPARSITSIPERAVRRPERRIQRISRDIERTAAAYDRLDAMSGRMTAISGRMATPPGPDSSWSNQQKAQWKAEQWRKRFLFDEALNSARVNLSPELQAHIAKYPDTATAARAIMDMSDKDLDALFKAHNDALKGANISIKSPRRDELPLLPSEVAEAAQIKRPLVRAFLDEYKKMAPNGTLSRLDVDTMSNEDIEEMFNRYILPEMVDPTRLDAAGVIDVAQRISQPGQENSPLRLLDNLAYMASDDMMSLEARRRILEERLNAGIAAGTITPAQQQATQNALDAIDLELAKLVADYEAGQPLDTSIPFVPENIPDPRKMPRWAGERRALDFNDPVTAEEYVMFLLENEDVGFHPEWGPITRQEWDNWYEDIQERIQRAQEVYMEGGELEAEDAINALTAEYQQYYNVGVEAGWIEEQDEEEPEELTPEQPIRDEFGVLDEDWVWNTEFGSPEELGVTDDPSTWALHPDNVQDDGVTPIELDELEQLILKYAPRKFQADLLEMLKPSEWTDPHSGHIDQRYVDLPPEMIDYFVAQAMGTMPPMPSGSGNLPTPNMGGVQGDGVGISDPGGPRLRRGIPFIPRNINWDSALRMFKRIIDRQGTSASAPGSYRTASLRYDPALGVYEDWGPLQLQNQFVEAAKAARELYVSGTGQDSRKAREQVWNLLQAGRTPEEIGHELIIFGADQPDTDRPPQPLDVSDLVKAAATAYAIENNLPVADVSKILNANAKAFNADATRQETLRRSQLERLRSDLDRLLSGQSIDQIIKSIDGLIEETERKKWFADQAYRIERGHDARLRKAILDLAEMYPLPTARRQIFMEPDGSITGTPSRNSRTLYQEPYTGEISDDPRLGWPLAFDEGYDPTKITRARQANRIYRWWRQNWGYVDRDENGEIVRQYVGPLQGTLTAHQTHARKYGNAGLSGTTAYATKTADARVRQLKEVQKLLSDARREGRNFGISGYMRNAGPNLYESYSRNAARSLVAGRKRNRPASMLLGYDSDGMPVTRAMRIAFTGGSGKFKNAENEHSFASIMNPENVDYFNHLSPVEKDYFRSLYSDAEFIIAVPREASASSSRSIRGKDGATPDEKLTQAFYKAMSDTRPTISGQMGLKRNLSKAKGMAKENPDAWRRRYMTARNSFRMRTRFSRNTPQNYDLELRRIEDSVFGPTPGLYLVDRATGNVIDGPYRSTDKMSALDAGRGAMRKVKSQNYPRPWEQMPEIQEAIAHGVSREMRDFLTLDEPKLSDIRSTVNDRALALDKGVPQEAADTAVFSRDPDTGDLMVLMIQREWGPHKDDTGAWVLPGGFSDPGETSLETSMRELAEETGIKLPPESSDPSWWKTEGAKAFRLKQIGTIEAPDWDVRFTKGVKVGGAALFVSPDIAFSAGDDARRAQWINVRDIADGKVPVGFGHIAWIKNALGLEKDDPEELDSEFMELGTRLDRIERATRARNKELIEISNDWRKKLNASRDKDNQIPLFDEKNLGSYSSWELIPSDDMMYMGTLSRLKATGRPHSDADIRSEIEKNRESRLSRVGTNFGPSISGQMGSFTPLDAYRMHISGKTSNDISEAISSSNNYYNPAGVFTAAAAKRNASDDVLRATLSLGMQLNKESYDINPGDEAMFIASSVRGENIADIARRNKLSVSEATNTIQKFAQMREATEPEINKTFRKAIKKDKKLSGAEKQALIRRLNGATAKEAADFLGIKESAYEARESKLLNSIRESNPKMFKSAGAWSDNARSLAVDQEIFMRFVHDRQPASRIAANMGMTEKMVGNIVKRYARWRDSNAPIETASIKHALMKYANSLTPGENRLMGRIADGESVYDFASRMNMPRKSAVRMYNSAMRKLHIESKVAPKSRVFSANIFKAAPKRWISPVMPADIFAKTRAISGRMGNESTAINNIKQSNAFNESERAFTSAPMNVLREMALDVRQELRDQVAELTQTSAEMHPVLGGHDGVKKMATLGAYISRTLENARITALLDEYKTAKTKFIPRERREAVEAKALLDATKNLSEELWLKKQMMDLAANIYDSYEKASWPWRQWDSSSPEWKRHLGVFETMEMYKIDTPSGRRKYINDGYYMPLTPREMEAFFEAVNTNNGITGKMSNPRQWARSRDLYEILGVPDTASPEDLKKAFRTKSRELHPDVNKRADADEQFKELGFAWETLSNSSLKAQYDSWRRRNTSGAGADDEVDNFKVDDNMYITDERGRLWLRHNADRDDWPTVPFTENTVFPQRKWTEQEFDEWSDWTSHKIQPSRPAGSALWGERGPGDDIRAGRGTGFEGGGGDFSPQDFEQQLRDEGVQFWDERTMGPPPNPNDFPGSGGFPSAQGSIAGRMSNFSPLDDSTRQRLGIGDLPSLYDQQQLTAQYPKDTAMFYAAKPGEPAIEVTTTFGGKLNLAQHRYDNVYRPIIDAMINAVRQNKRGRKRFISVGGPAGSGKTTDRKTGAHGIPVVEDALHVDADEIKTLIPEARALHAAGNPQWAGAVHEESRIIADLALQEAIANGLDVVYDSTGQYNSGFGTLQAARNAGYDIVMHYNTAEPDALAAAIESRSQTDSRRLPTGFNNAVMQRNKTIMPSVAKAADEFYLWDSSDIKSRKLLAQKQTPQSMLQIMDPNAYVYGNFDEAGQAITKGGRPTARLNQYRYAAESPEGRAIRAFENGSTIDQISEEMPEMKRDRIFDVVTGGVIDPTLQYRPPAAPSQRPAINPEKKIDDFVSDDNLESIWNSLEEAQQQIVRNVLNKQPGAMDEFDDSGMPMDIIIWAAQNNISGKMGAVYDRDRYSASDVSDAILDVYGRGLQIAEMLEALKKDYDISMGRVDLTARITRLRKAGKLDTYRLPNKKQTARKIKKSATQKFIDKRDNQIIRLAKTRPNLTANEIAAIINSMPIPPGVAVQRMSASSVSRIVNKKGK